MADIQDGGLQPFWRKDGRELIYAAPDGFVMAVDVGATPSFQAGVPKRLFKAPAARAADVSADAEKFIFLIPVGDSTPSPITVVMNWAAGLKK
jgi:hypothetical protein